MHLVNAKTAGAGAQDGVLRRGHRLHRAEWLAKGAHRVGGENLHGSHLSSPENTWPARGGQGQGHSRGAQKRPQSMAGIAGEWAAHRGGAGNDDSGLSSSRGHTWPPCGGQKQGHSRGAQTWSQSMAGIAVEWGAHRGGGVTGHDDPGLSSLRGNTWPACGGFEAGPQPGCSEEATVHGRDCWREGHRAPWPRREPTWWR